jgi:hypothetical protein
MSDVCYLLSAVYLPFNLRILLGNEPLSTREFDELFADLDVDHNGIHPCDTLV